MSEALVNGRTFTGGCRNRNLKNHCGNKYLSLYVTVKVFKGLDGILRKKQAKWSWRKECSSSGTPKAGEGNREAVHLLEFHVSPQCWGMWEWEVWKPWGSPAACAGQSWLTELSSAEVCPHQQAVGHLTCTVVAGANLPYSQNVCEMLECQRENWMVKCKVELQFFLFSFYSFGIISTLVELCWPACLFLSFAWNNVVS